MKFIDNIEIYIKSGDGGSGIVSFRAARNRPKLGADGGNGGKGGNVILQATSNLNTLSSLRYRQWYNAEDGERGGTNCKTGKCGEDKIVHVPLGTVAINHKNGEILGELLEEGQQVIVAKGGKRGYGNFHFLSGTHQSPREFSPGEPGEEITLQLELKLLADVGLAGFPNAGKSTLLSVVSAAKPRIADYPFTTLIPNLGVVDLGEFGNFDHSFVMADVPGLIEGAWEGKGLGHAFLKHLERTKIIMFVVDAFDVEERTPFEAVTKLQTELKNYSAELAGLKSLILINKIDLAPDDETLSEAIEPLKELGMEIMQVSAVQRKGIKELKLRLYEMLNEDKEQESKDLEQQEYEFMTRWAEENNKPIEDHSGDED